MLSRKSSKAENARARKCEKETSVAVKGVNDSLPRRHGKHGGVHGERPWKELSLSPSFPPCTSPCLPCLRGEKDVNSFTLSLRGGAVRGQASSLTASPSARILTGRACGVMYSRRVSIPSFW